MKAVIFGRTQYEEQGNGTLVPVAEIEPNGDRSVDGDEVYDVADLALVTEEVEPMVIGDLLRPRGVLGIVGEEGDGKTTFADQFGRQIARGQPAMGIWAPGELAPERILFVDTHQELPEIQAKAREMDHRGLVVPRDRMLWWDAGALDILAPADQGRLRTQVVRSSADFVWIDAASHLVADSKDDVQVRALFDYLSDLMRTQAVNGVGLTLFPRKKPCQGFSARGFDDLFGSREWKGRLSTLLYLDAGKIIAFKDRPGFVRRSWPKQGRYPTATLERPGLSDPDCVPFHIVAEIPEDEAIDRERVAETALELVGARPDHYTKTSLADALGVRREAALGVIGSLFKDGRIGPEKARAKLHLVYEAPERSRDETLL
jgi:hypothetical protein